MRDVQIPTFCLRISLQILAKNRCPKLGMWRTSHLMTWEKLTTFQLFGSVFGKCKYFLLFNLI